MNVEETLQSLLKLKKIHPNHYLSYKLFEENELGKHFLNAMLKEESWKQPPFSMPDAYAVKHGRLSFLADITNSINEVKEIMRNIECQNSEPQNQSEVVA